MLFLLPFVATHILERTMRLRSLLICLNLTLISLSSLAAETAPVPIDVFVHRDKYDKPRLSPDGKFLAVTMRLMHDKREVPTIAVLSLPELKLISAVQMPVFNVPINYLWVSNTRLVVEKGKEIGSREQPRATGEVLAMDYDGSHQEYLYGYEGFKYNRQGNRYGRDYGWGQIVGVPRPRNNHLMVGVTLWEGNHSILYDVNTGNSIRKLVADIPVRDLSFTLQQDGKPRFASGFDNKNEHVLYRRNDSSGDWELLESAKFGGLDPLAFSEDGSEFAAIQSIKGGPDVLIRENIANGARTVMLQHPDGSINDFLYGIDHGIPLAASSRIDIPQWHYFNPRHPDAQLHKLLSDQFPDSVIDFINFTDDGKQLLFSVASDRDPSSFYIYDRRTGKADFLMAEMEEIDPDRMAERRPIQFRARDGLTLHGFLTLPPHPPATGKPALVLMPHGGPISIYDSWYFDRDAQFLASRGYAVLQVNYRGSGGRGVDFEKAGQQQWGGKIQDDLVDGVQWVRTQGLADPARACVFGGSFGGYSALMLAARDGALFRCAVGYAGVYDLKLFTSSSGENREKSLDWRSKWVGNDEGELARQSPAMLADKITIPVLLVHGGKDERAPKEHAFHMRDALIKAGRPPEWLYVDYEGHGFYDTENLTNFYQMLETFLAKHLK
jgi:dipeptidyl aminopeptidase/acylaminoacyl peptidase